MASGACRGAGIPAIPTATTTSFRPGLRASFFRPPVHGCMRHCCMGSLSRNRIRRHAATTRRGRQPDPRTTRLDWPAHCCMGSLSGNRIRRRAATTRRGRQPDPRTTRLHRPAHCCMGSLSRNRIRRHATTTHHAGRGRSHARPSWPLAFPDTVRGLSSGTRAAALDWARGPAPLARRLLHGVLVGKSHSAACRASRRPGRVPPRPAAPIQRVPRSHVAWDS